ncbi:MAG: plasmid partitioning/stability family protein [Pantoea sp.]|uniref:plasmid partitioning/stability family protein n=1 Tax=Pantoea sp. TaxID=69393 RepID=UPI002398E5C1|nr:plasmid partitioning/stability family protein [Pantoea sp.]MDE1188887.1 plasmid partitioning/stability family protein [Pantoea sp.]
MDTRRKIQFYINPKSSPGEEFADAFTESTQQGERGRLWKAAMLSGFALQRIDPRLPFLLSELLSEKTTAEEVLQVIRAVSPKNLSAEQASASAQTPEVECPPVQPDAADETRNNAKQMFGSD